MSGEGNPKRKRIKRGFSRKMTNGEKCTVFFEYYCNKITICHCIIGYVDPFDIYNNNNEIATKEFIGISILDPRDTYNKDTGEKIALTKALIKMNKFFEKLNKCYIDHIDKYSKIAIENTIHCKSKLEKIQEKNR